MTEVLKWLERLLDPLSFPRDEFPWLTLETAKLIVLIGLVWLPLYVGLAWLRLAAQGELRGRSLAMLAVLRVQTWALGAVIWCSGVAAIEGLIRVKDPGILLFSSHVAAASAFFPLLALSLALVREPQRVARIEAIAGPRRFAIWWAVASHVPMLLSCSPLLAISAYVGLPN